MKLLIQVIDLAVLIGALYCSAILLTGGGSLIAFPLLYDVRPTQANMIISGYMFLLGIVTFYFASIFVADKLNCNIKKRNYIACILLLISINVLIIACFYIFDFDVLLIKSSIEIIFPVLLGLLYAIFRRRMDFHGRRQS
jgi:hypothetical protein